MIKMIKTSTKDFQMQIQTKAIFNFLIGNCKFSTYGTHHLTGPFDHISSNWTDSSFL